MYIETKQLFYSYKVDASGETIARWVYGSDAPKLLSVHVAEHRDYNLYYYMQWRRFRVASGGGGGGGDGSSHLHLATLLVSESWQQLCSVASFWVLGGGGQAPQMYRHKKKNHIHVTYMQERAKQASASETYYISHMVWRYK